MELLWYIFFFTDIVSIDDWTELCEHWACRFKWYALIRVDINLFHLGFLFVAPLYFVLFAFIIIIRISTDQWFGRWEKHLSIHPLVGNILIITIEAAEWQTFWHSVTLSCEKILFLWSYGCCYGYAASNYAIASSKQWIYNNVFIFWQKLFTQTSCIPIKAPFVLTTKLLDEYRIK